MKIIESLKHNLCEEVDGELDDEITMKFRLEFKEMGITKQIQTSV
jgi:hypothetical protein